jgi:hypothetical protein
MDAGKLVAAGTHDQLQNTCRLYARLAGDFTGADDRVVRPSSRAQTTRTSEVRALLSA